MRTVSRRFAIGFLWTGAAAALLLGGLSMALLYYRVHRYDDFIRQTCRPYGVDPRLVSALIWQESRFDPDRVGRAGEVGLMQVTSDAAKEWARAQGLPALSRRHLFNPYINIRAGTWYLARALRFWSGKPDPLPCALAEYNAGRSNAQRWAAACRNNPGEFVSAISYPTTRRYVKDILRRYRGKA